MLDRRAMLAGAALVTVGQPSVAAGGIHSQRVYRNPAITASSRFANSSNSEID